MEEWKNIPDEGLNFYQISNLGHARIIERDVPTHIFNHGRDMIVTAHRKGHDLKVSYDGGTPTIRLKKEDGSRCRRSLPMLVLRLFGEPCPGDLEQYTGYHINGDITDNSISNLTWVSRATLASTIGKMTLGEEKEHFQKYHNLVFTYQDYVVAYFKNTTEALRELNSQGFNTSSAVLIRALQGKVDKWFYIFDIKEVTDEEYFRIQQNHKVENVKLIYDVVMLDRSLSRRQVQTPRPKVEKKIVEKIVYVDRVTQEPVRKLRKQKSAVSKTTTIPIDTTKEIITKVDVKPKASTPIRKQMNTSKLDLVDDSLFYKEQERIAAQKKADFMAKLQAARDKLNKGE